VKIATLRECRDFPAEGEAADDLGLRISEFGLGKAQGIEHREDSWQEAAGSGQAEDRGRKATRH